MFGNRTISSRLCEARSQAEPGARLGGSLVRVCSRLSRPAGLQRHPSTPQISALLLLFEKSNHKYSSAGWFVFFQLICQLEKLWCTQLRITGEFFI